jgi:glutamine cyclotransferase
MVRSYTTMKIFSVAAALVLVGSMGSAQAPARAPVYGYRVVNTYPHDPQAYTQGLIFRDGVLFESTGLYGRSTLRKVKLETGEVLQQERVDPKYFAEGLADWSGRLIQLTWQSKIGFVYDRATFRLQRTFAFIGDGWGLTQDGTRLIMSDGTDVLRFLDPATFQVRSRLPVKDAGVPVAELNELEYVRGEIYANVYMTNRIARISPQSGRVLGWIDLTGLLSPVYRLAPDDVLNGIAFDPEKNRLFVTGKRWPKLFEITLERRP